MKHNTIIDLTRDHIIPYEPESVTEHSNNDVIYIDDKL